MEEAKGFKSGCSFPPPPKPRNRGVAWGYIGQLHIGNLVYEINKFRQSSDGIPLILSETDSVIGFISSGHLVVWRPPSKIGLQLPKCNCKGLVPAATKSVLLECN